MGRNAEEGVTWIHSYVSDDGSGRTASARAEPGGDQEAAAHNRLPVDWITEVRISTHTRG